MSRAGRELAIARYPRKAGRLPTGARLAAGKRVCALTTRLFFWAVWSGRAGLWSRAGHHAADTGMAPRSATRGVSADPLSQGDDDPLWPANVGHAPDVLVLTDAADQAIAVRDQPVDRRLQVVDFE
jgi:hypothetical protein